MEDKELVKIFNPTLKMREAILFFLIMVINWLKCIVSDIGLDRLKGFHGLNTNPTCLLNELVVSTRI